MVKRACAAALVLAVLCPLMAKDKKKSTLPTQVLVARTVAIVTYPGTNPPLANPGENRSVESAVQDAIERWGRFHVTLDVQHADLVIAVRKGHAPGPVLTGAQDRLPTTVDTDAPGTVRVGIERGTRHPVSLTPEQPTDEPGVAKRVGPTEDLFEVYRGGVQYPLDNPAVFRYAGKDALSRPSVKAVAKFRQAIEEAEKKKP